MKRYFLIICFAVLLGGCSSHAYYDEAMLYMAETTRVLIEEGVCQNKADCSKKEMVFWTAGGWEIGSIKGGGVTITVYNVSSTVVAGKIIQSLKSLHTSIPTVPVTVTIFANAPSSSLLPSKAKEVARERIVSP